MRAVVYRSVDVNPIAPAPEGMDLTLAATVPLNTMAASLALDHLPLRPRDTLLSAVSVSPSSGQGV